MALGALTPKSNQGGARRRFWGTQSPPPHPQERAQDQALAAGAPQSRPGPLWSIFPRRFLPNSNKTVLPAGPNLAFPGVFNFVSPSWEPNKRLNLTNLAAWQPKLPLVFLFVTEPPC